MKLENEDVLETKMIYLQAPGWIQSPGSETSLLTKTETMDKKIYSLNSDPEMTYIT